MISITLNKLLLLQWKSESKEETIARVYNYTKLPCSSQKWERDTLILLFCCWTSRAHTCMHLYCSEDLITLVEMHRRWKESGLRSFPSANIRPHRHYKTSSHCPWPSQHTSSPHRQHDRISASAGESRKQISIILFSSLKFSIQFKVF